jgi:hypothetical protein
MFSLLFGKILSKKKRLGLIGGLKKYLYLNMIALQKNIAFRVSPKKKKKIKKILKFMTHV